VKIIIFSPSQVKLMENSKFCLKEIKLHTEKTKAIKAL